MKEIISVEWLNQNLDDKDLIILDASIQTVVGGLSSVDESITIKGARFFDLKNNFTDKNSLFPNTIPTSKQFEIQTQKLGVNESSKIVVFDNLGIYSSPRVWWLFKIMSHENILVLDGGLPAWINKGFETEKKSKGDYKAGNFQAKIQRQFVINYQAVLSNVTAKSFKLIDVRSKGRFQGTEPEPRKYLRSGHIPASINIPYQEVLEGGFFKSKSSLKGLFEKKGLNGENLVFSCGSGLTACIVMLAYYIACKKDKYIYDGSWSEWAELQNLKNI